MGAPGFFLVGMSNALRWSVSLTPELSWSTVLADWAYHSQMFESFPGLHPKYFCWLFSFPCPWKFCICYGIELRHLFHPWIWGQSHCLSTLRPAAALATAGRAVPPQTPKSFSLWKPISLLPGVTPPHKLVRFATFLTSILLRDKAIGRKPGHVLLSVLRAGIKIRDLVSMFSPSPWVSMHPDRGSVSPL